MCVCVCFRQNEAKKTQNDMVNVFVDLLSSKLCTIQHLDKGPGWKVIMVL